MSESIEDVIAAVDAGRAVGIEIHNSSGSVTLNSPSTYCDSGYVSSPPSPSIEPGETDTSVFVKKPHTACGSVGVLSYNICDKGLRFVLMFSNPYDYNLYSSEFALYMYETSENKPADYDLYNQMYSLLKPADNFQKSAVGKSSQAIRIIHSGIEISATMSNDYKAVIKVKIEN
ncbi:uncharacterized protein LOC106703425 [Latimeria chalumnae]|uniref:uncharacterized protein LOC106703425 n=1 Tax=Latimeria chalumnae TaxID=7897 RepID=UPI00313E3524